MFGEKRDDGPTHAIFLVWQLVYQGGCENMYVNVNANVKKKTQKMYINGSDQRDILDRYIRSVYFFRNIKSS